MEAIKKHLIPYCFLLFLFLGSFANLHAQNGVKKCSSTRYSMVYNPAEINNLDELPKKIKDTLENQLIYFLGKSFYEQLVFDGGKIINYKALLQKDPQVANYKWKAPTYDLRFALTNSKAGINFMCSRIILDSLGGVITNIGFPEQAKNTLSTQFKSLKVLKEAAAQLGYGVKNYEIGISKNHIVLLFWKKTAQKKTPFIELSVHTAAPIKKYKITAISGY